MPSAVAAPLLIGGCLGRMRNVTSVPMPLQGPVSADRMCLAGWQLIQVSTQPVSKESKDAAATTDDAGTTGTPRATETTSKPEPAEEGAATMAAPASGAAASTATTDGANTTDAAPATERVLRRELLTLQRIPGLLRV